MAYDQTNNRHIPDAVYDAVQEAAETFDVTVDQVLSGKRKIAVVDARQMACKSLQDRYSNLTQVGRWMNLDHTSVLYLLTKRPFPKKKEATEASELEAANG